MLERGILGSGQTRGVSFWPFPNSSGWWWLISSIFLIRISCHKTTHADSYCGAWPGWAVSISVLPLTLPYRKVQGKLFLFIFWVGYCILGDFPGSSVVKKLSANAGEAGSIPESGRSPGKGNGNPLQYSCLGNTMDREACWAIVRGVSKNWTRLSE